MAEPKQQPRHLKRGDARGPKPNATPSPSQTIRRYRERIRRRRQAEQGEQIPRTLQHDRVGQSAMEPRLGRKKPPTFISLKRVAKSKNRNSSKPIDEKVKVSRIIGRKK